MNFAENKDLNCREIEQRNTVLASHVTSLVVTLTTRCNILCRMCEEHKISWEIPEKVINEIVSLMPYLEQVIWQGGEVLLLDYFKDVLLEEARRNPNLHQSIITNGLPIDEEIAEKLVGENMELTFSIDGTTKESYENIRQGGQFEKLIRNIRLIHEVKNSRKPRNMTIRMHAVIMRSNYRELEHFVAFAKEHGFDALHLMPIWGNYDGDENIFYHQDREALSFIGEHVGNAEKMARDYQLNFLNSLPAAPEDVAGKARLDSGRGKTDRKERGRQNALLCHMPWRRMVINPAGFVCPACHCKTMIGNVNDHSLAELWNGKLMQQYRENIVGNRCADFCNPACLQGVIADELRGLK